MFIDRNGPQYGVDYSYDPENRLVTAQDYQLVGKKGTNRIDRAISSYEYDGGGRRLVQHYDPKNGGNGVDKRDEYVFGGLDPVAEYDMLNGQRIDYYRGADDELALMHLYKGGTQGQMYWYHSNNKGDVVGLTKQNGNSHHNYRYEPYGAVLPENGNFTDPHNHYTLTGKEFDENTGLVWFGARFYEPETGVWMNQDVYRGRLSEPGSLHRFMYVNDNPINSFDWYGYWSTETAKNWFESKWRSWFKWQDPDKSHEDLIRKSASANEFTEHDIEIMVQESNNLDYVYKGNTGQPYNDTGRHYNEYNFGMFNKKFCSNISSTVSTISYAYSELQTALEEKDKNRDGSLKALARAVHSIEDYYKDKQLSDSAYKKAMDASEFMYKVYNEGKIEPFRKRYWIYQYQNPLSYFFNPNCAQQNACYAQ